LLEEPLRISNGQAVIAERAGNGLSWDQDAIKRYQLL
jgi:mandelate racemase